MGLEHESKQDFRPWNPFHLGLISYFCIILPGGFLFAQNYEKLGLPGRKRLFQVISLGWFVLFLCCVAYLPEHLYWLAEIVHLAFPIGMLLLQNPHYQMWREETAYEMPTAPIQKQVVLSVLFALLLFAGIAAKDWYLQEQLETRMEAAQQAYMEGNFNESILLLRQLEEDYPKERLVLVNQALAYEAAGKRDSAILSLRRWLQIAPEDQEAADLLYKLRYGSGSE